jgi:hypothetical protein
MEVRESGSVKIFRILSQGTLPFHCDNKIATECILEYLNDPPAESGNLCPLWVIKQKANLLAKDLDITRSPFLPFH